MHKVFGCGIDIEEITRFDNYIENNDYSLMKDICTKREFNNLCGDNTDKRVRFALSFSCKEAFFKALGVSWTNSGIFWKDIELLFSGQKFDSYCVNLSAYAKELLVKNNAKIAEASFDYNEEIVIFQVILLKSSDDER